MTTANRFLIIASQVGTCVMCLGLADSLADEPSPAVAQVGITNSIGMKLVSIPAGEFLMGSPDTDMHANQDEQPQHRVKITKPFYLGVFEVTQSEYEKIMRGNPSYFSPTGSSRKKVTGLDTTRFPVEHVRWTEAMEFCAKLSQLPKEKSAGHRYRLPTEAEWEYACRAGSTTAFHFGKSLSSTLANFNGKLPSGGATVGPFLGRPAIVGSYKPNPFGLYDMHGNVWEWCFDWYRADYYKDSPAADPQGAASSPDRSIRGGSWADDAFNCRSAYRFNVLPVYRYQTRGFRVAMTIGKPDQVAAMPKDKVATEKPLSEEAAAREKIFQVKVRPFLKTYCFECHDGDEPEAGLSLSRYQHAAELATTGRKTWKRVWGQLLAGTMPPEDAKQPHHTEVDVLTHWIDEAVAAIDCTGDPDPGHETIRRLNRAEYRNTIRDLLGIDYAEADDFPTDDVGAGGDALSIAPILMERYLKAAEDISGRAIVTDGGQTRKPPTHQQIIFTRPGPDLPRREAARTILERLAFRAYRRPATDVELERLLRLIDTANEQGESFEESIQLALQTILVSPNFLFKVELHPPSADPQEIQKLSEYELATRMSYFLWSSMPDDKLFQHARQGTLRDNLDAQVRRMLKDSKSQALGENFGGTWLQLSKLKAIQPDKGVFPEFDEELRAAMQTETQMFLAAIIREDRSMLELLTADFTFVNQRLAKHYGMKRIKGSDFQRVSLRQQTRGGLLTQASVLTLTSNPTRTSPVKRGKWIMEAILGTPPPAPPPGASEFKVTNDAASSGSMRERMALHATNPRCAACHQQMDSLGFALENFDALGRWRTSDGEFPIDASGELPGGMKFRGPAELKLILSDRRKDDFIDCLTEKMLAFALGRELEYYDRCAVEKINKALSIDHYRFSTLVTQIINSQPFQKNRAKRKSDSW